MEEIGVELDNDLAIEVDDTVFDILGKLYHIYFSFLH